MGDPITQGFNSLASASENANLTVDGAAWCQRALNLFEDVPTQVAGLPDNFEGKSIVREFTSEVTLSKTDLALTAAGNWECHIDILPLFGTQDFYTDVYSVDDGVPGNPSGFEYAYGVAAPLVQLGMFTFSSCVGSPNTQLTKLYPDPTLNGGWNPDFGNNVSRQRRVYNPVTDGGGFLGVQEFRLLGIAFEVENVTNQQFVNGYVTTYRVNSAFDERTIERNHFSLNVATFPLNGAAAIRDTNLVSLPINQKTQTQNLPLTKGWHAAQGCYVTGVLDSSVIEEWQVIIDRTAAIGLNNVVAPAALTGLNPATLNVWSANQFGPGRGGRQAAAAPIGNFSDNSFCPLSSVQTCGAMFTGLSPETVLILRMKCIVETVPVFNNPDLVLARTSAMHDPNALELYARTSRGLPTGCPRHMNPFGEWFALVMDMLAKNASVIGGAISAALVGDPTVGAQIGTLGASAWTVGSAGMKRFKQ